MADYSYQHSHSLHLQPVDHGPTFVSRNERNKGRYHSFSPLEPHSRIAATSISLHANYHSLNNTKSSLEPRITHTNAYNKLSVTHSFVQVQLILEKLATIHFLRLKFSRFRFSFTVIIRCLHRTGPSRCLHGQRSLNGNVAHCHSWAVLTHQ